MKLPIKKLGIILFFAAFLFYGLATVKDYGVSFDEGTERTSSLVTYKYVYSRLTGQDLTVKTDEVDFSQVTPLHEYTDRYYGVALQLPTVVMEHLRNFEMSSQDIFFMRHTYNFLFFFAAAVFFYLLLKEALQNRGWALIGTLMLIISPRILADAFYNIKDLLFLSIFVINLYFAYRLLKRPGWIVSVLFAVTTALCTNTRIVGALVPLITLCLVLIKAISEKNAKQVLPYVLGTALLCVGFYAAVSPVLWEHPLLEAVNTIKKFSDYGWGGSVYYRGTWIAADNCPWYYIFLWILVTTPLSYILLFLIGTAVLLGKSFQKKSWESGSRHWDILLIFLLFAAPMAYFMITSPTVYNGWRHFYFVYPCIIAIAVYGLSNLTKLLRVKIKPFAWVPLGILAVSMGLTFLWLVRNHPYGNIYFQPFFREWSMKNLEKDYWMLTERECLEWIAANDDREQVTVSFPSSQGRSYLLLDESIRGKLSLLNFVDSSATDYIQIRAIEDWQEEEIPDLHMYEKVYEITTDGYFISGVYKRVYGITSQTIIKLPADAGSALTTTLNGSRWVRQTADQTTTLTGSFDSPQRISRIMVRLGDEALLANLQLQVSSDGTSWTEAAPLNGTKKCFTFTETNVTMVKIICPTAATDSELTVELLSAAGLEDEMWSANSMIAQVMGNEHPELLPFVNDNTMTTCWYSGPPQTEGSLLSLTLKEVCEVSELRLPQGEWGAYFPHNLKILARQAETGEFVLLDAVTSDNIHYTFPAVRTDMLKLTLGEQTETVDNTWSVYEVELLGKRD